MNVTALAGSVSECLRFYALLAFLTACLLGGGSARSDVLSLLYVRPAAVVCIAIFLMAPGSTDWRRFRIPLLFLTALGLLIAFQLIPLPPGLWLSLPGHERYAEAAGAAGLSQPWRPLSLTPDLTWNSLLSLLPPFAVLIGFAAIREDQRRVLLPLFIAVACITAAFGVLQLTGGAEGPLYLYRQTHNGSAVGFFANRNHQAALLAMALPALRVWSMLDPSPDAKRRRGSIAIAIGLFLLPMILVTGSRAGIVLGIIGLIAAFSLAPLREFGSGRWGVALKIALWATPIVLMLLVIVLGRALAIDRLVTAENYDTELRLRHLPLMLQMTRDFLPFGIGFGAFDPVFRNFEPDATLSPLYFNHAHNDLLEFILTGGLPAALILVAFLIWWGSRATTAFFRIPEISRTGLLGRLGAIVILIAMLASLVDYPLRTPLMAVVFTLACGWLEASGRSLASSTATAEP